MIAFSTPYYLSKHQARSWHTNKGEKSLLTTAAIGASAYGLTKPNYAHFASQTIFNRVGAHVTPKQLGVAAGVTGTYAAYHYARAGRINSEIKRRPVSKKNIYAPKTDAAFNSARRAEGNIE